MNIKIVDANDQEVKQEVQTEMRTQQTPIVDGDLLIQSVGQIFDMRPQEIQASKDKINLLIEYAHSITDDKTTEGLKWAIRSLQGRVGTPPLGEKWLPFLTKYAYLKLEGLKLQKEVEQYEHNNH
jgi:hypothetical protein